jgi:TM2 domain-containing membrane protein YozV
MLPIGQLSPDRTRFWDGQKWASVISPDGRWLWDGQRWVANFQAPSTAGYMVPMVRPGAMVVAPKNPAVSLIVSFFIPGVGSMVNGDTGTGIAILLLWLLAIALDITVVGLIVGVPLGIAMFIWGLYDAYTGAQRWNARHGILS